jgi:hypothetical protein
MDSVWTPPVGNMAAAFLAVSRWGSNLKLGCHRNGRVNACKFSAKTGRARAGNVGRPGGRGAQRRFPNRTASDLNINARIPDFLSLVLDRLFPGGFGKIVQAFTHRNYRIYAAGNAVSLIGVWMQRVAVGWLA